MIIHRKLGLNVFQIGPLHNSIRSREAGIEKTARHLQTVRLEAPDEANLKVFKSKAVIYGN